MRKKRIPLAMRISYPDQDAWKKENFPIGVQLGYPQCCIDEFCVQSPRYLKANSAKPKDFLRYKAAHLNGVFTGFIPCYKHAALILENQIRLQDLIQKRDKNFPPFPVALLTNTNT